jgi:hypothetical protein
MRRIRRIPTCVAVGSRDTLRDDSFNGGASRERFTVAPSPMCKLDASVMAVALDHLRQARSGGAQPV